MKNTPFNSSTRYPSFKTHISNFDYHLNPYAVYSKHLEPRRTFKLLRIYAIIIANIRNTIANIRNTIANIRNTIANIRNTIANIRNTIAYIRNKFIFSVKPMGFRIKQFTIILLFTYHGCSIFILVD